MSVNWTPEYLGNLVSELRKFPRETGWIEFKGNIAKPEDIGEYISALSNAAALNGQSHAYIIWGIEDSDHNVIGTNFDPESMKIGNENL